MVARAFRNSSGRPQERDQAMDRATFARPQSNLQANPFPSRLHRDLEAWVRRRAGATDHERRVVQVANAWFDLTRDLHDLDRRAHWALIAAAIVHDVGRSIDPADHAVLGAELILADPALSLSSTARRWLAYLRPQGK